MSKNKGKIEVRRAIIFVNKNLSINENENVSYEDKIIHLKNELLTNLNNVDVFLAELPNDMNLAKVLVHQITKDEKNSTTIIMSSKSEFKNTKKGIVPLAFSDPMEYDWKKDHLQDFINDLNEIFNQRKER